MNILNVVSNNLGTYDEGSYPQTVDKKLKLKYGNEEKIWIIFKSKQDKEIFKSELNQ